ncbi:MAG: GNAT family N-acetyltransferase [Anaerolineales bacterium]|uniref:GNAT family N-acetyltransferase n=1 Tax=Candidatus Villigracilis vicinus TaxID=3140679 RepID=UPI003136CC84|nr:GNAT family N-acetyltransferase [Anaerolineales bacterium]
MSSLSLKPAHEYSTSFLADLMTRSFEAYFVPINITDTVLLTMLRRDGIDLTASRVLMKDGEPVGLAMIARRGWTSRLAAMGITVNARGSGVGTWAMAQLVAEARERGDKEMLLEVIEQNTAGVKLYEKSGFKKMRRLVGYKLNNPQVDTAEEIEEIDIRELARTVTYHGMQDLPWQLSGTTIMQHTPPSRAFRLNDAYCLISNPDVMDVAIQSVLVKARSRGAGLSGVLLRTLFAKFPGKVWHVSAIYPEEMGFIFEHVGMQRESLSQWQMSRAL